MAQNKTGGIKARASQIARLGGEEAYREHMRSIGKKGGSTSYGTPRGFARMTRERLSEIGRKGGRISRRGKAKKGAEQ